ncbi:ammonium transporter [Clydaea vesicula]|uniref:Extracellular metalloproteinase n=1 Tax=Clydaea vesicula TaxID=447962 RepID=A0AAD5TZA2_9FUNG|nr:ammonium transporter [Clydaea vesicula]
MISKQFAAPAKPENKLPSFYFPPSSNFLIPATDTLSKNVLSDEEKLNSAVSYMMKALDINDKASFQKTNVVTSSSGVLSYHCAPVVDGIPVVNAAANINTDKFGNVISMGSSWITKQERNLVKREETSTISASEAFVAFATSMNLPISSESLKETAGPVSGQTLISGASFTTAPVRASLKYYRTNNQKLEKVFDLSIPMKSGSYYNAFISVNDQSLVGINDWTSKSIFDSPVMIKRSRENDKLKRRQFGRNRIGRNRNGRNGGRTRIPNNGNNNNADTNNENAITIGRDTAGNQKNVQFSYNIIPLPNADFSEGRAVVTPPQDTASPFGWHNVGSGGDFLTTVGNNVVAQENTDNAQDSENRGFRPQSENNNFNFEVDDVNQQPSQYVDASTTNIFFQTNVFHDIMTKYGFDENNGNFQLKNVGNGGRDGDPIVANAQDGSGVNNANFASPPDGISGRMNMFIFDSVRGSPNGRDGGLDNQVVLHELMHGVSSRVTGGPDNANCLSGLIGGGLGEGWSDFLAMVATQKSQNTRDTDIPIGAYVTGNTQNGVRNFPLSTSLDTNPLSYGDLSRRGLQEVHAIGEVWAAMLNEAYWNLVDRLGFEADLNNFNSGSGNTVMLQLVMDGLKLQPCNPSFIQARDAIIQADIQNNNGQNECDLFKGFAKRGLGFNAVEPLGRQFVDNLDLPPNC